MSQNNEIGKKAVAAGVVASLLISQGTPAYARFKSAGNAGSGSARSMPLPGLPQLGIALPAVPGMGLSMTPAISAKVLTHRDFAAQEAFAPRGELLAPEASRTEGLSHYQEAIAPQLESISHPASSAETAAGAGSAIQAALSGERFDPYAPVPIDGTGGVDRFASEADIPGSYTAAIQGAYYTYDIQLKLNADKTAEFRGEPSDYDAGNDVLTSFAGKGAWAFSNGKLSLKMTGEAFGPDSHALDDPFAASFVMDLTQVTQGQLRTKAKLVVESDLHGKTEWALARAIESKATENIGDRGVPPIESRPQSLQEAYGRAWQKAVPAAAAEGYSPEQIYFKQASETFSADAVGRGREKLGIWKQQNDFYFYLYKDGDTQARLMRVEDSRGNTSGGTKVHYVHYVEPEPARGQALALSPAEFARATPLSFEQAWKAGAIGRMFGKPDGTRQIVAANGRLWYQLYTTPLNPNIKKLSAVVDAGTGAVEKAPVVLETVFGKWTPVVDAAATASASYGGAKLLAWTFASVAAAHSPIVAGLVVTAAAAAVAAVGGWFALKRQPRSAITAYAVMTLGKALAAAFVITLPALFIFGRAVAWIPAAVVALLVFLSGESFQESSPEYIEEITGTRRKQWQPKYGRDSK